MTRLNLGQGWSVRATSLDAAARGAWQTCRRDKKSPWGDPLIFTGPRASCSAFESGQGRGSASDWPGRLRPAGHHLPPSLRGGAAASRRLSMPRSGPTLSTGKPELDSELELHMAGKLSGIRSPWPWGRRLGYGHRDAGTDHHHDLSCRRRPLSEPVMVRLEPLTRTRRRERRPPVSGAGGSPAAPAAAGCQSQPE